MKKIGTITFHSSYNYGSCLQAYALQEFVKSLSEDINYEIINYRSFEQKKMYKSCFEKKDLKSFLKRIYFYKNKNNLIKASNLFESFINDKLDISNEISTKQEVLEICQKYDYIISGSDQIWNIKIKDFFDGYYLNFKTKAKKIAYAPSLGPKKQEFSREEKEKLKKFLNDYDYISVRENGSADKIKGITGINPVVLVDPTMLLTSEDWIKLISKDRIIKDDYIFLYNLKNDSSIYKMVEFIRNKTNLKIVVPRFGYKCEILKGYEVYYATGPLEFLNLIYYSKLTLSSSFHGTVFSILLNKPFFSLNGDSDLRISNLLKLTFLEDRAINIDNVLSRIENNIYKVDFSKVDEYIDEERKKSKIFLEKALEIEND